MCKIDDQLYMLSHNETARLLMEYGYNVMDNQSTTQLRERIEKLLKSKSITEKQIKEYCELILNT